MRRLPTLVAILAASSALALRSDAQSTSQVLHVPIPGDLPVDDGTAADSVAPPAPASALQNAARDTPWRPDQPVDETVTHPRATWEPPVRSLDRNTQAPRDFRLHYREVFTPAVAPFKRLQAYDAVDETGQLTVRDPSLRPVRPGDAAPSYWGAERETFVGEVQVELTPAWPTPVPGVAGEQRVLSYTTSTDQPVEFAQDSAGNLFVRGLTPGTVTLRYVLEAPASAFSVPPGRIPEMLVSRAAASVPSAEHPVAPAWLSRDAETVTARIGVSRDDRLYDGLNHVVDWFRRFQDGQLQPGDNGDLYTELALGRVGACRHRAYAAMLTLQYLGLPARYVGNEAHAWIETLIPGVGWTRIDLGGWDVPLDAQAPSDRPTFQARRDPFSAPAEYNNQYSTHPPDRVATSEEGEPDAGAAAATNADPSGAAPTASATDPSGEKALENSGATPADGTRVGLSGGVGTGGNGASGAGAAASGAASNGAAGVATGGVGTGVSGGAGVGAPRGSSAGGSASPSSSSGTTAGEDPDAEPERTVLTLAPVRADESAGFQTGESFVRGSMLHIEGDARDENGAGIPGMVIEVHLVHGRGASQSLGSTVTRPDGHWDARVMLPAALDPGDYSLRAFTPGDSRHTSAAAE